MRLEHPIVFALNRLLVEESWARERLAPFEGDVVELRAPPLPPARLAIRAGGTLAPAAPEASATLTIVLGPGALAAAAQGEEQLMRAVEVSGNARLASEVMHLVRHLRWDPEEALSRVLGDVAAHRVAGVARAAAAWHVDALRRLGEAFVEYATEERPLLVPRAEIDALGAEHAALRDAIERLDKRVARLESAR